jgi:hypothetical protein
MNLGTQQGVAVGHVLAIKERARSIRTAKPKKASTFRVSRSAIFWFSVSSIRSPTD